MSDTFRWVIAIVALALILGLIAFARGGEHRRGDEVGALPAVAVTLAPAVGGGDG